MAIALGVFFAVWCGVVLTLETNFYVTSSVAGLILAYDLIYHN